MICWNDLSLVLSKYWTLRRGHWTRTQWLTKDEVYNVFVSTLYINDSLTSFLQHSQFRSNFPKTIKHKVVTFIMTESVSNLTFWNQIADCQLVRTTAKLYNAFCGPAGMSDLDLDANNLYFVGKIIWWKLPSIEKTPINGKGQIKIWIVIV